MNSASEKVWKRSSVRLMTAGTAPLPPTEPPPPSALALAPTASPCSLSGKSNDQAAGPDPFVLIGEDVHRHILSYVLRVRSPPKAARVPFTCYRAEQQSKSNGILLSQIWRQWDFLSAEDKAHYDEMAAQDKARYEKETKEFKIWGPKGLQKSCNDFSLVSRLWRDVTGDVMNLQAPADILTPRELAKLKSDVAGLELTSVGQDFIRACKRKWHAVSWPSSSEMDDCFCYNCGSRRRLIRTSSPLDAFIKKYGGGSYDRFATIVAVEYMKFLVVRGVETIAAKKELPSTLASWKKHCQPSTLVDMFWQAHVRSSLKYGRDCVMLIGELLDFEGDDSDHPDDHVDVGILGSSYKSKKDTLYEFEKQFQGRLSRDHKLFPDHFNFEAQSVGAILETFSCSAHYEAHYAYDSYNSDYPLW